MTDRNPALEPFHALLGSWLTEATHPAIDAVVAGTITFQLLAGQNYLTVNSSSEHELLPDFLGVIGLTEAGDQLVMEYFDSRGVRRTYRASLEGGVLRFWRDAPGFDQRFRATLGQASFDGLWQLARSSGDWRDDLRLSYRRSDEPA